MKDGKKISTVSLEDLAQGVLFIKSNLRFTTRYLALAENIFYHGPIAVRGFTQAYKHICTGLDIPANMRKPHAAAVFYYLAVKEFQAMDMHKNIIIGEGTSAEALAMYDNHIHQNVFPPQNNEAVKELVGDGHQQVKAQCASKANKKSRSHDKKLNKKRRK